MKHYYVYIMASRSLVLYVGVTSNLERRVQEHRQGTGSGFTCRYRVTRLLYYETLTNVHDAIGREKQIKAWRRDRKIELIRSVNPQLRDLASG